MCLKPTGPRAEVQSGVMGGESGARGLQRERRRDSGVVVETKPGEEESCVLDPELAVSVMEYMGLRAGQRVNSRAGVQAPGKW